jgi:dTDP-4-amino-4,6-dideoxygalactose transaminase
LRSNWQSYAVLLPGGVDQKAVMQRLLDQGISTRRGVMCSHLEPPYAPYWPQGCLPASEAARDRGVILPLHHKMTAQDCAMVAEALGRAMKEARS